ncbi:SGNH/GDSL hydrolase family protein, partial [Escherichia coli]|nr:SGNH/GDSL hydrolase family protein [Escherichia coli]
RKALTSLMYQIERFPGGQIRHFLNSMSYFNKSGSTHPETLILLVGTNNMSHAASNSHFEFLKLVDLVKSNFPKTKICITPVTISDRLRNNSPLEAKNMSDFNFLLRTKTPGVCVIRQYPNIIFTQIDSIHWTANTANNIVEHWVSELGQNLN